MSVGPALWSTWPAIGAGADPGVDISAGMSSRSLFAAPPSGSTMMGAADAVFAPSGSTMMGATDAMGASAISTIQRRMKHQRMLSSQAMRSFLSVPVRARLEPLRPIVPPLKARRRLSPRRLRPLRQRSKRKRGAQRKWSIPAEAEHLSGSALRAAMALQRLWRAVCAVRAARTVAAQLRAARAAAVLQRSWREARPRIRLRRYDAETWAATVIANHFRCWLAVRQYRWLADRRLSSAFVWESCSKQIRQVGEQQRRSLHVAKSNMRMKMTVSRRDEDVLAQWRRDNADHAEKHQPPAGAPLLWSAYYQSGGATVHVSVYEVAEEVGDRMATVLHMRTHFPATDVHNSVRLGARGLMHFLPTSRHAGLVNCRASDSDARLSQLIASLSDTDKQRLCQQLCEELCAQEETLEQMLEKVPLLCKLSADARHSLVGKVQRVEYDAGAVVAHQGEAQDSMYLVLTGSIAQSVDEKRVCVMRYCDFCGELALLSKGATHATTLTAVTACELALLPRDEFWAVVRSYKGLELALRSTRRSCTWVM